MSSFNNLLSGQPDGRKAREFAGFKVRIVYSSPTGFHVESDARYSKADADAVFKVDGVGKVGPNGFPVRYSRGEWKTFEQTPDGEVEITNDQVRYLQTVDGQQVEVDAFDATKTWDIKEDRPVEECTLDGPVALGTVIPRDRADQFGPDKEDGSKLYEVWGEGLLALADKLEREKLALYFPHVFRRGMTIHLSVASVVRFDSTTYFTMRTYAGPVILKKALQQGVTQVQETTRKPMLIKPSIRKRAV